MQYQIDDTDVPDEMVGELHERHQRLDLTNILTFTIDPENSQDFDDALSVEYVFDDGKKYIKIGIHIADVSEYVKKDSELDKEAEKRTISYYYSFKDQDAYSNVATLLGN